MQGTAATNDTAPNLQELNQHVQNDPNLQPLTQCAHNSPLNQITFQQNGTQPQQPNQNIILNTNQQVPLSPHPHLSTQPPNLGGVDPFVIPGFNTLIALPRLAVTAIQPQNTFILLVEPLDNGSYFQGGGSVNTGHICSTSKTLLVSKSC